MYFEINSIVFSAILSYINSLILIEVNDCPKTGFDD